MLRIVPHTVPRLGRSYEHFPDGFEFHLLPRCFTPCRCAVEGLGIQEQLLRSSEEGPYLKLVDACITELQAERNKEERRRIRDRGLKGGRFEGSRFEV
jgi:hypothetical protein